MSLAEDVYQLSEYLPSKEKYSLISQIRRSAISIPSNIAEGAGRNSNKEFTQFLSIALGSLFELETQLILTKRLKYLEESRLGECLSRLESISKMIYSLKKSLDAKI